MMRSRTGLASAWRYGIKSEVEYANAEIKNERTYGGKDRVKVCDEEIARKGKCNASQDPSDQRDGDNT